MVHCAHGGTKVRTRFVILSTALWASACERDDTRPVETGVPVLDPSDTQAHTEATDHTGDPPVLPSDTSPSDTAPTGPVDTHTGPIVPPAAPALLISEVCHGPTGELLYLELYNDGDADADLGDYELRLHEDGSVLHTASEVLPAGTLVAPGATWVITADEDAYTLQFTGSVWQESPDQISTVIAGDGNDVYTLRNAVGSIVDVYGEVGQDGTGTTWEYTHAVASRLLGEGPDPVFDVAQWSVEAFTPLQFPWSPGSVGSFLHTDTWIDTYVPGDTGPHSGETGTVALSWATDVSGLMTTHGCTTCHGSGGLGHATLDLTTPYSAMVSVSSSQATSMLLVDPYDAVDSYLYHKLAGTHVLMGGSGLQCPQGLTALSNTDLTLLSDWIDQGALP